jgi:DNA-binding MarR family transcriptional regulator
MQSQEQEHTPGAIFQKRSLAILRRMGDARLIATHWMNGAAGSGDDTSKTRRLLKRMEREGLVEGVEASRSGRVFWWKATDKGLAAISKSHPTTGGKDD